VESVDRFVGLVRFFVNSKTKKIKPAEGGTMIGIKAGG
jgi:hypothetical protein